MVWTHGRMGISFFSGSASGFRTCCRTFPLIVRRLEKHDILRKFWNLGFWLGSGQRLNGGKSQRNRYLHAEAAPLQSGISYARRPAAACLAFRRLGRFGVQKHTRSDPICVGVCNTGTTLDVGLGPTSISRWASENRSPF